MDMNSFRKNSLSSEERQRVSPIYHAKEAEKNVAGSRIPRPKQEKNEIRGNPVHAGISRKEQKIKKKNSTVSTLISSRNSNRKFKTFDFKENLKDISKTENFFRNSLTEKNKSESNESCKPNSRSSLWASPAHKMTSDTLVFNNNKVRRDVLCDIENEIYQIASAWVKTSEDFSKTMWNLKNTSSLCPTEMEIESERIEQAIDNARSLTVSKTRNIIMEIKKLLHHREKIRTELENLISEESLGLDKNKKNRGMVSAESKDLKIKGHAYGDSQSQKSKLNEVGRIESPVNTKKPSSVNEVFEGKRPGVTNERKEYLKENSFIISQKKSDNSSSIIKTKSESKDKTDSNSDAGENERLATEISKKNQTIALLNTKILELQKACNDQTKKYNKLQLKFEEYHCNIEWNQIFRTQIVKLKARIKSLEENYKQTEAQKRELETKVRSFEDQVDSLQKLNHLLSQKNSLLNSHEKFLSICPNEADWEEKLEASSEGLSEISERVLKEKRNVINELKNILEVIKDHGYAAQKQIAVFESKIEELKNSKNT